jgi:N utilization substance protein A
LCAQAYKPFSLKGLKYKMPQENTLIKLVKEIADSKKISFNSVVDELKGALKMTYDKHLPETVVAFDFDIDNNTAAIYEIYEVIKDDVDEFDDYKQIQLADAKKFAPNAKVGDEVKKEIKFDSFDKTFIKDFLKNFRLNTATIVNKNMYEI